MEGEERRKEQMKEGKGDRGKEIRQRKKKEERGRSSGGCGSGAVLTEDEMGIDVGQSDGREGGGRWYSRRF